MTEQTAVESELGADAERLDELQAENESLRSQLEAIQATEQGRQDNQQQLREQVEANEKLRRELGEKALTEAIRAAAAEVGIDPDLALLQGHRFQCGVDDAGVVRIEPDPAETFAGLARTDPLFRRVNRAVHERRRHRAAIAEATAVDESDAVDLIGYLDRNSARRYEFIQRHGKEKFFELLRTAKRRGYRGQGR